MRDVERLTETRKRLILLEFVSYEAVRLWWWGGSNGVVDFEKTPFFCSIPTLASNPNREWGNLAKAASPTSVRVPLK